MILDKTLNYKGRDSNKYHHYHKAGMEDIMRETTKCKMYRLRCLTTLSLLYTHALNGRKIVNKELRRMWKQGTVAYLKVLP
jgi:hypothetical protein